jgi:diguanylate cyclase (GGDEF)-like protein
MDNRTDSLPGDAVREAAGGDGLIGTNLRAVLASIGETLYDWDMVSDRLAWGASAAKTLKIDVASLGSGRAFAQLVVPDAGTSRYDCITRSKDRDSGFGVQFQTIYAICVPGGETLWVEDTGRWFAGLNGRPVRVHGVLRVIPAPSAQRGGLRSPLSDPLTGGLTRTQLGDLLSDEIGRARREGRPLAMALVAVEDLADLNRSYGVDVADEIIAAVAGRLRTTMRRGDALARYAGNKLAVVLMGCAETQLEAACARLSASVRNRPLDVSAGALHVAVRIGAVHLPRHGQTSAQAMQNAEDALAEAKASATAECVLYRPDRRRAERRESNRRFTDEIVAALNERRVQLARQPIVAAGQRSVAFHEALLRVRRRDGVLMAAGEVVPQMEQLGLVSLVDHRVLELAVASLVEEPGLALAINVSPATTRSADFVDAVGAHVTALPFVAPRLTVEITETSAISDMEATVRCISRLRDLGVRVAIDDFGSGHTSFRHLRDLAVDIVKIDGAFVQNLNRSSDDRFFVRTLLDLARHIGVKTVAEWVRDEETARQLESWGVDYMQGELFGRAEMPGQEPQAAAG